MQNIKQELGAGDGPEVMRLPLSHGGDLCSHAKRCGNVANIRLQCSFPPDIFVLPQTHFARIVASHSERDGCKDRERLWIAQRNGSRPATPAPVFQTRALGRIPVVVKYCLDGAPGVLGYLQRRRSLDALALSRRGAKRIISGEDGEIAQ